MELGPPSLNLRCHLATAFQNCPLCADRGQKFIVDEGQRLFTKYQKQTHIAKLPHRHMHYKTLHFQINLGDTRDFGKGSGVAVCEHRCKNVRLVHYTELPSIVIPL